MQNEKKNVHVLLYKNDWVEVTKCVGDWLIINYRALPLKY